MVDHPQGTAQLSSQVVSLQRVGLQRSLGWTALAGSLAALGALPWLGGGALPVGIAGGLGVLLSTLWLWGVDRDPAKRQGTPGRLRVEGGELVLERSGAEQRFDRDDVDAGWLEESDEAATAVLRLKGGILVSARVEPEHRAQAEAVLQAVGADAKATMMRVPCQSRRGRYFNGCMGVTGVAGTSVGVLAAVVLFATGAWAPGAFWAAGSLPLMAAFLLILARQLPSTNVTVGTDGVMTTRAFERQRFVSYGQVSAVRVVDSRIEIATTEGETVLITSPDETAASAVAARIEAGWQGWQSSEGGPDLAVLERGGRSYDAWRAELVELLDTPRDYRRAAPDRALLLRIAEDPSASPERRVGAALAVAAKADEPTQQRLRIAADGCAQKPLRVALGRAADGDLAADELEEALVAYEAAVAEEEAVVAAEGVAERAVVGDSGG